nr:reverse transcriptase domain-containing protein [Tanacetum cinerariifolium]
MVRALLLDKKNQSSAPAPSLTPAPVKEVEPNCVSCGGTHSYQNCPATSGNVYRDNIQEYVSQAAATNYNQGNTGFRPQIVSNQIRPPGTEVTKGQVQTSSSQSTAPVQPSVIQSETQTPISEPVVAPVSVLMPNLKSSIPYPSRSDNERHRDQANEQIDKFYEIFKDMSFEISFTDALILMPKFASTLKALIGNKEKLSEMARTSMNEHCSTVILNMLPRKLGDPGKFLIPCEFPRMDECLALPDLGASINLMSLSAAIAISCNLVQHSRTKHIDVRYHFIKEKVEKGIVELLFVGTEYQLADLFTKALLEERFKYLVRRLGMRCLTPEELETLEYSQEVLGFSDVIASGNLTPYYDPIFSTSSSTLTPFGDSDFLLEEVDAFLALEDDATSPEVDQSYYDLEGDILLLKACLNDDPSLPPPTQGNYLPQVQKELKICKAKMINLQLMSLLRLNLRTYLLISNTHFGG